MRRATRSEPQRLCDVLFVCFDIFLKDSVKLPLQNISQNSLPIKAPLSAARTASVEDEVDLTQTLVLSAGRFT